MQHKKRPTLFLAQGAAIAALYVILTLVLSPISFGPMQVRVAEALTILPMFTGAAIPGLFIGCLLANLLGSSIVLDVVVGSIATLIGAALSYLLRFNRWLVPIPPILSNMLLVPLVLKFGYGVALPLPLMSVYVCIGEIIGCYVLGELVATLLLRHRNILGYHPERQKQR